MYLALIAAVIAVTTVIFLCAYSAVRVHLHPARGTLYIYELSYDPANQAEDRKLVFTRKLGRVNRFVYTRGIYWQFPCPFPRLKWDSMPKLLRRIEIVCPDKAAAEAGRVIVKVWTTKQKRWSPPHEVPIDSGDMGVSLAESYLMDKDPAI